MKIFPAIDIKGGKCVRLLKGDFDKSTVYKKSPIDQAKEFSDSGFQDLHIVDLDGALKGEPVNGELIEEICKLTKIRVQIENTSGELVLASDGFFPFADTIELANKYEIKSIVQPGGSLRDQESIDMCDLKGISMMVTKKRHFLH